MKTAETKLALSQLPRWHQEMLIRLLDTPFPGQKELKSQVLSSLFTTINERSIEIFPTVSTPAPVVKTVPVEAVAYVKDEPISALLYTSKGFAYLFEIF